jgi:hypothetical protein
MSIYNNSFSSRTKRVLLPRKLQIFLSETIYSDNHHLHPLLFIGNQRQGFGQRISIGFSCLGGWKNALPAEFPKRAASRRVAGIDLLKHSSILSLSFNHPTSYDSGRYLVNLCGSDIHQHGFWDKAFTVRCDSELWFMAPYFNGWLV